MTSLPVYVRRSLSFLPSDPTISRNPLAIVSPPELNHWVPVVKYKFSMP